MSNSSLDNNGLCKIVPGKTIEKVQQSLGKRHRAEKNFRRAGMAAIFIAFLFLVIMFCSIIANGYTAFSQTFVALEINFDPDMIPADDLQRGNYSGLVKKSLRKEFPEVKGRQDKRTLYGLVSTGGAYMLSDMVKENPHLIGTQKQLWLPADGDVDMLFKGNIDRNLAESERRLNDKQLGWIDSLEAKGKIKKRFNTPFFTSGDSRDPELAGIAGAAMGSLLTLVITLVLSFPIGVAAAVYLEEFARKNKFTDIIEVNINNLAAVPSIVFGLLGLAVFINFFGLPRSAPIVGGLVLTLMTLPTIIIASRSALQSVPPSIREAALGVGASKMQAIVHHVLPLALPGMLTGAIIGMARALGESAPLLMIGMVAFIVDVPGSFTDPSTALPVQIYLWADSPERGFVEKTSAATMILLAFLIAMNSLAVYLRRRFETRW